MRQIFKPSLNIAQELKKILELPPLDFRMYLFNILLGVFFSSSLASGQGAIFGWDQKIIVDSSVILPDDYKESEIPVVFESELPIVNESSIVSRKKRSAHDPTPDSKSSEELIPMSRDHVIDMAKKGAMFSAGAVRGQEFQCSKDLVKKEGGKMPCVLVASGVKPISFEGYTENFSESLNVQGLQVYNLIAIATGSADTARRMVNDEKVDFAILATGPDFKCSTKFLEARSITSTLIGPGRIILSEENSQMDGHALDGDFGISVYSSPFSPVGSVHFDSSMKYAKSIKKTEAVSIGSGFIAKANQICTPTLVRIAVSCDVGEVRLITGKGGNLHESKIYKTGKVLVPSKNEHPPSYFFKSMSCVDYRF